MSKPEDAIERYLVQCTETRGGWAAKMVDKGRRGAPDRELRFPNARTIYIETKAKNGRVKRWQTEYHNDLRKFGYTVAVLWTKEQITQFFADYDKRFYMSTIIMLMVLIGTTPAAPQPDSGYHPIGPHVIV